MKKLNALGLFSGCGALELGAQDAGFEITAGYDNDPIAVETFQKNISANCHCVDLSKVIPSASKGSIDLLLGGPPCQGFSSAGPKKASDLRNSLWKSYVSTLSEVLDLPSLSLIKIIKGVSKNEIPITDIRI